MAKKSLLKEALRVNELHSTMESYDVQEKLLRFLVDEYPDHTNYDAVDTKVKLLNLFYSTGIQATATMTRHIMDIPNIDQRLKQGDLDLVPEIATLKLSNSVRFNYSFATKYCALHEPKQYPIYDSIVAAIFQKLMETGQLDDYHYSSRNDEAHHLYQKGTFQKRLKEYPFFVKLYQSFRQQYGLSSISVRKVDTYLWGAYKLPGEEFEIERMTQLDQSKYIEYKKR